MLENPREDDDEVEDNEDRDEEDEEDDEEDDELDELDNSPTILTISICFSTQHSSSKIIGAWVLREPPLVSLNSDKSYEIELKEDTLLTSESKGSSLPIKLPREIELSLDNELRLVELRLKELKLDLPLVKENDDMLLMDDVDLFIDDGDDADKKD